MAIGDCGRPTSRESRVEGIGFTGPETRHLDWIEDYLGRNIETMSRTSVRVVGDGHAKLFLLAVDHLQVGNDGDGHGRRMIEG